MPVGSMRRPKPRYSLSQTKAGFAPACAWSTTRFVNFTAAAPIRALPQVTIQ